MKFSLRSFIDFWANIFTAYVNYPDLPTIERDWTDGNP